MKKLLQINVVANWGSTGKITENIGKFAMAQGWESYIAYGRGEPESASQLLRVGNNMDMYTHIMQSRLLDNHGLASKHATQKFIEDVKRIRPDVIDLHNIHGYYLNYKLFFEFLATLDIPVLWTMHDCWSMTGHCSHFDAIDCNKWQSECCDCPLKGEYPASLFMDASKRNFRLKKKLFTSVENITIVSVSRWLANIVQKSYMAKYPIRVINNGVDTELFKPRESNLRVKHGLENKFVLIGVASIWNEMKGFDDFIHLANQLSDDYRILLIGLTKKQIEKLPFNITGIERTENQFQLAEYYSMADVFVNPTYNDSFPTVNIEALACGTPIVTYKTGGSPEIISKDTGLVVGKGDLAGLKMAIEAVRNNDKRYYSVACRNRALKYFIKDEQFREYVDLYDELLCK
jgi:glycosyltransferase involved in cell wall biosynthesis